MEESALADTLTFAESGAGGGPQDLGGLVAYGTWGGACRLFGDVSLALGGSRATLAFLNLSRMDCLGRLVGDCFCPKRGFQAGFTGKERKSWTIYSTL